MSQLEKRVKSLKHQFYKKDRFPYPFEELKKITRMLKLNINFTFLKESIYRYWDIIASLALGGIINYIEDDEKREWVKDELHASFFEKFQEISVIRNVELNDYESFNQTYLVYENTRHLLMDLITDYENNSL